MPANDDYMKVAHEIAQYLNSFGLAFKTYKVDQLDDMMTAVAGTGARLSTESTSSKFTQFLLERGFTIYPTIMDAKGGDGYVRVIRGNSIVANLLNALRYPGSNGDSQLANLLTTLYSRRNPDNLNGVTED
ncbi:MAG: hypothetical protein RL368_1110 [Pseudomonadota bacterium]|jgi:hypothetical protein